MSSEILVGHAWLTPLVWQSTLCLAAGLGGSFLLRKHAVRAHQVLLLSLVAAALIPALSQVVKRNQWGLLVAERAVLPPASEPARAPAEMAMPSLLPADESPPLPTPSAGAAAVPETRKAPLKWTQTLPSAWVVLSSVLLLRLVIQFLLGWHLAGRSEAVDDAPLLQMVEAAKDKLRIRADVRIRLSAHVRSPVIWCWGRRPVLLVPRDSLRDGNLDWPSILCHELAHARRHDHISGLFAEFLVCVLPWQPLLWWARQRLGILSEEACDDWVIASGQRATGYARTLLGLIPQARAALLPGVITNRQGLSGRVRRILEDGCGNPRPGLRWTLALVASAGCVSLGLAFAQTRPAPRPPAATESSDASRVELGRILAAMLEHDRAVLPIALHVESELYNLDAPADGQHIQTLVMDQRADGRRFDSAVRVRRWRNGQPRDAQVNRSIFAGDQYVYRQQLAGTPPPPLTASLHPKEQAFRILTAEYTLLGYLPDDEKPVGALLQSASHAVLYDHREDVDGFACAVIEATTDHGVYKLWIDPAHDYRIRRALIDRGADDLYYGKPLSTPGPEGTQDRTRTSIHMEISEVHLEEIDGHFIPTAETLSTTFTMVTGRQEHTKAVTRRSGIDLKPDFEKLGAFVMDGILEGLALANLDPNDHTYAYEWHHGKAVSIAPNGGIVTGRIQFPGHADLSTILTGRRNFHAWFQRSSTTESADRQDSHGLDPRPEKNGAFVIKDVPPGQYRLRLSLMDMVLEKTSNGGFAVRGKTIAETEREFTVQGKDATQKTVDLGVIEMTLPSTAESSPDTDAGKGTGAPREPAS